MLIIMANGYFRSNQVQSLASVTQQPPGAPLPYLPPLTPSATRPAQHCDTCKLVLGITWEPVASLVKPLCHGNSCLPAQRARHGPTIPVMGLCPAHRTHSPGVTASIFVRSG